MIYAVPGASFEAVVDWGTTGLVGSLGIAIEDNIGGVTTVRTTAGIIEIATGVYAATLTAPATAGQYSLIWDDTATFVPDDLVVTSTTAVQVVPASGPGMTLGDILDAVLLDRFEAAQRPRALQAVNSLYAHLWALEDWTFKYATINPTVASGDNSLNGLPSDFGVPIHLWDEDGNHLIYQDTGIFYTRYLASDPGGPECWTVTNQGVILGPTPDHDATYTTHYRKRLTMLTDESEVPTIPAEFQMALVHGAGGELRVAYDDPTAPAWQDLFQRDIEAMRREYLIDAEGQPSEWGSDLWAVGC